MGEVGVGACVCVRGEGTGEGECHGIVYTQVFSGAYKGVVYMS